MYDCFSRFFKTFNVVFSDVSVSIHDCFIRIFRTFNVVFPGAKVSIYGCFIQVPCTLMLLSRCQGVHL